MRIYSKKALKVLIGVKNAWKKGLKASEKPEKKIMAMK